MPDLMDKDSAQYDSRTRLPITVEEEDPFISVSELKISLRQTMMLFFGLFVWYVAVRITLGILPLWSIFGYVLWAWIPAGTIALAFGKRHGLPLEQYLAEKIIHKTRAGIYVPRDDAAEHGTVDDHFWDEDEL